MLKHFRFRTRTLLALIGALAIIAGAARWWYDARLAEYERQRGVASALSSINGKVLWSTGGPERLELWRVLDERLLKRATHAYGDGVATEDVPEFVSKLNDLRDLKSLVVLGRQIIPHARIAASGADDSVINSLRGSSVRHLIVDASIRGTPLQFDAPIYTRDDRALLEQLLPNLKVEWIEAN